MLEQVRQKIGNFKRILLIDCKIPAASHADSGEPILSIVKATEDSTSWDFEFTDEELRALESEGRLAHVGDNLARASANIPAVDLLPPQGVNVYSILQNDAILLTVDALRMIEGRLLRSIKR